jgi:hypothetical protein
VAAHHNWNNTDNDCGYGDQNNITGAYGSTSGMTAHSEPDGTSVVDKGNPANIGCNSVDIACTWTMPNGTSIVETDQRFSTSYAFTNTGAAGAYDYESVGTHETGHSIGLNHVTSSQYLTMYTYAPLNSTEPRTLGRGDILGMRKVYP